MYYTGKRTIDKLIILYLRNIPDHFMKLRLVGWISRFLYRNEIQIRSNNSVNYSISPLDYIGNEILQKGNYEPRTLIRCLNLLSSGGTFLDIGANFGLFTFEVGKLKNTRVYAVEPTAHNFIHLQNNKRNNDCRNITFLNCGLGEEATLASIINPRPGNAGTFRVENSSGGDHFVHLSTLGDLINKMNLDQITLIKIDVEGYEMNILKGMNWLHPAKPLHIVMEFTEQIERTGYSLEYCYNYLKGLDYSAYTIDGIPYKFGDDLPESNLWWKLN